MCHRKILFVLYLLASILGPVVSIVLFALHGDEWTLVQLSRVFYAGTRFALTSARDSSHGGLGFHPVRRGAGRGREEGGRRVGRRRRGSEGAQEQARGVTVDVRSCCP